MHNDVRIFSAWPSRFEANRDANKISCTSLSIMESYLRRRHGMRNLLQTFLVGIQPLSCTHDSLIEGDSETANFALAHVHAQAGHRAKCSWKGAIYENLQWFQTADGHIISIMIATIKLHHVAPHNSNKSRPHSPQQKCLVPWSKQLRRQDIATAIVIRI